MGRRDAILDLERRFRSREISNSVVADESAAWFAGRSLSEISEQLDRAPWIDGIEETVRALAEAGCRILLATVTWRFVADILQGRYGFDGVSGTEMGVEEGVLSGTVSRYFDEWDKLRFVETWCDEHGFALDNVAAVGDSRSDVPLFERVGLAIALNATDDARAAADRSIDSDDLTEVLPLLLGQDGPTAPTRQ
jgi:phosphoserine phosphatase